MKVIHHASPMHQHPNAQICIVIQGAMVVRLEDGTEERLEAGSACTFAPDEVHQVENPLDEVSVGIEVFVPGRSFDFWLEKFGVK
jgi:quercetin dioxygenase-like cupin family protein